MRLFVKIFLCAASVLSIALSVAGYMLTSLSFDSAVEREKERAFERYEMLRYTLQSNMLNSDINWNKEEEITNLTFFQVLFADEQDNRLALYSEDKTLLYSGFPEGTSYAVPESVTDKEMVYTIVRENGRYDLIICGKVTQSDITLYLSVLTNISTVVEQKEQMVSSFQTVFGITIAVSILVMLVFSTLLTHPIKKLTRSTAKITAGNYSERVEVTTTDEIGELGSQFNEMADRVERNIEELQEAARQQEDFVANFAHELKTPLTSIIGYSDMIYQKEMSRDTVKDAAGYILHEGMRLEALSLKLMDMIVLGRQEFVLEEISIEEVCKDTEDTLMPTMRERQVVFRAEVEPAYILVEYDLFKTMLLNIIDNAMKAGCSQVVLSGKKKETGYELSLRDNGRGIPEEELGRITEAFYMVDKSRARKQHGAGLGLALVVKIVHIHGGTIRFESEVGKGTEVILTLQTGEGASYE